MELPDRELPDIMAIA